MVVAFQVVGVAVVPLKVIVLVPCVAPKFMPLIVTGVPARPELVEMLFICGATVNVRLLLGEPPTVTTTGPVAAAAGTGVTILVEFQLVGIAAVPLNVTVLVP
jgi:hypothetical protein